MKNLKNIFATSLMAATLLFGTTFANAGIVIAGLTSDPTDPCTDASKSATDAKKSADYLNSLTGIVIAGFTGIVIAGVTDPTPPVNCGIVIAG